MQHFENETYFEINDKDPKFKVGDHERTSKYKNVLGKDYSPN